MSTTNNPSLGNCQIITHAQYVCIVHAHWTLPRSTNRGPYNMWNIIMSDPYHQWGQFIMMNQWSSIYGNECTTYSKWNLISGLVRNNGLLLQTTRNLVSILDKIQILDSDGLELSYCWSVWQYRDKSDEWNCSYHIELSMPDWWHPNIQCLIWNREKLV